MASDVVEMMNEAKDRAVADLLDVWVEAWERTLGPSTGTTLGDVQLTPAQRIERFIDLADRGVLDVIQGLCEAVDAPHYDDLLRQYVHDITTSPLIRSA